MQWARIQLVFLDRDGNEGAIHWYIAPSFDESILNQAITIAAPRIEALSDARFIRATLEYRFQIISPELAPLSSNVRRKALLIFQNADDELDALTIVSPIDNLYESDGPYAGIRVKPALIHDLEALFDDIEFVTKDGRNFGPLFVAGGLAY